jgi:hypothetical protein
MSKRHALGTRYRKVHLGLPAIAYAKNNVTRLELPNGLIQKELVLRLTGNLVTTGANVPTIFSEAPLGLIRKVELVGDGRRYLCSADARDLWHLSRRMHRKKTELRAPASAAAATSAFSATFMLDADALNFADGSESMLDTRIFKKLELVITWGSETDISIPGASSTAVVDATTQLDVMAIEVSEGVHKIIFDHVLASSERAITATSADVLLDDIPQSGLLAGILFRTTREASVGPVPVDDIINSITIVSDVSIKHVDKIKWRTLQSREVAQFLIDGGDATTGQDVGYAYLDLTENGMFSSALNINALNKAQLKADVTSGSGTQLVHLLYDFFEPRGDASAEAASS